MPDADNPDRLLSTLLIGNNRANTAASAAGTALAIEFAPGHPVLAATIAVTVILLLFAEITPKVLAASFAEPVVLAVAQPLDHIARVATPLIKILSLAPRALLWLLGGGASRGMRRSPRTSRRWRSSGAKRGPSARTNRR
ncbi:MAG: DUF21 domain-containing protein [Acidobacteria bacterium]|nr:DUF21 domain-containing protein [Acidobacteriota bacterium]